MMKKRWAIFVAAFTAVMSIKGAQASVITYTFQGAIGISSAPGISVGDTFSGTLVYDNAATLLGSGQNYSSFSSSAASLTVTVGGLTYLSASPLGYLTSNDVPYVDWLFPDASYDSITFSQTNFAPTGPFAYDQLMRLIFVDAEQTVFSGDASTLPASLPDPFDYIQIQLWGFSEPSSSGAFYNVSGLVTSFEEVVPAPASLLLLMTGLAGIGALRRRHL